MHPLGLPRRLHGVGPFADARTAAPAQLLTPAEGVEESGEARCGAAAFVPGWLSVILEAPPEREHP